MQRCSILQGVRLQPERRNLHPGQQPFPGTGWHLRPAPHTPSGPVPSEGPGLLLPVLPLQLPILQAAQGPVSHPSPTLADPDRVGQKGSPGCGRSAFRALWGEWRLGHTLPVWHCHWLRHNPPSAGRDKLLVTTPPTSVIGGEILVPAPVPEWGGAQLRSSPGILAADLPEPSLLGKGN